MHPHDPSLDSCINQEVGKEFFKERDSRSKDKVDKLSFKRILSFGKGKKKAPGLLLNPSVSPSRRNSTTSISSQSSRTLSHRPELANNSRDSMSRDSGSCTSKNSTSTADSVSIKDENKIDKPTFRGFDRQNSEENDYYIPEDAKDDIPDNESRASVNSSSSQKRGFYHDQGVDIDFDKIPVTDDPVVNIDNEKVIDLDGGVIEDPSELSKLRGTPTIPMDNDCLSKAEAELQIDNNRIRLLSEVEKIEVDNDCEAKTEVSTNDNNVSNNDNVNETDNNNTAILRSNSHSPTFSEIDVLLGDISKDLDNLTF